MMKARAGKSGASAQVSHSSSSGGASSQTGGQVVAQASQPPGRSSGKKPRIGKFALSQASKKRKVASTKEDGQANKKAKKKKVGFGEDFMKPPCLTTFYG